MSIFLIDIGRPVVFVHVPKTGGTSVRSGRQLSQGRLYEPASDWRDLPAFGFVRDPFDRAESAWRDFRYTRPRIEVDFVPFLEMANSPARSHLVPDPASPEHHAAPMTHPVHGLRYADFVGRTETLQVDFDRFCDRVGVDRIELPRLRAQGDKPRAQRDDVARDLVRELYVADYEYLERMEAAA